ncbi:diphthine synthase [Halodesulfurarchaeum sp.]|uniref:diphthine synthase n=1 Tax=Halodesulfurarchaeum sp. TaxID=1980530 RepID=UPI002FC2FE57
MLSFVGLGLYDERSVPVDGREKIREADAVFAEFYTSELVAATVTDLESYHDVSIKVRDRAGVEQDPAPILDAAESGTAVFLTAGDPTVSTTHVDLRLRAHERGLDTQIVHAPTVQTAASGLTGLQNYRFGKATTIPFPWAHGGDGVPQSVIETIEDNLERGLHTIAYLDIKAESDDLLSGSEAASLLATHWRGDMLGVVVGQAGSPDPVVVADRVDELAEDTFGPAPHLLIIPGDLHPIERDALEAFANAPSSLLE